MVLPSPNQVWSHATNTLEKATKAVTDPQITAIEVDITMGFEQNQQGSEKQQQPVKVPILAHPPSIESDLSVYRFLHLVTIPVATKEEENPSSSICQKQQQQRQRRVLQKHIKLDFKDPRAVDPTLQMIQDLGIIFSTTTTIASKDDTKKMIFLNADILPGPGMRVEIGFPPPSFFLETCLKHFHDSNKNMFAFSLGYRVNYKLADKEGYTLDDVHKMAQLVQRYDLSSSCAGVVLAINARILSNDPSVFTDVFLKEFPCANILAWTGFGEPPIPRYCIEEIKHHFQQQNLISHIGFDCTVEEEI